MNHLFHTQRSRILAALAFIAIGFGPAAVLAADEVHVIHGGPAGWCSDFGQEIVAQPSGQLATCKCGDGWAKTGDENSDGEPECGFIIDTGGEPEPPGPDDPQPPGGTPPQPPPRPTAKQCEALNDQCVSNANALTQSCRSNRIRVYNDFLKDGSACHDQTLTDLLDGFGFRRLGILFACDEADWRDINDPATDNCRRQALNRGLDRCMFGVKQTGTSAGSTVKFEMGFSTPIWKAGGAVTSTTNVTVTTPTGIGGDQVCRAMGLAAADQCSVLLAQCSQQAAGQGNATPLIVGGGNSTPQAAPTIALAPRGHSGPGAAPVGPQAAHGPTTTAGNNVPNHPGTVLAPPDLQDRLRAQVDRARLGFAGNPSPMGGQTFRPLSQGPVEFLPLYIERLRFLAAWSGFLKRHTVSAQQQDAMEKALKRIQNNISLRLHRGDQILRAIWAIDMRSGAVGTDAARDLAKQFDREGGVWRELRAGHAAVRTQTREVLGDSLGAAFTEEVWPGIVRFTYANPMAGRPPVVDGTNPQE